MRDRENLRRAMAHSAAANRVLSYVVDAPERLLGKGKHRPASCSKGMRLAESNVPARRMPWLHAFPGVVNLRCPHERNSMNSNRRVRTRFSIGAGLACLALLAGCGGGGDDGGTPVIAIGLTAQQTGPQTVRLDWTDDPAAAFFRIRGEGRPLADVDALAYIDQSVFSGFRYCYDVAGYSSGGVITAVSSVVCINVL